jgi:hypothetical protein
MGATDGGENATLQLRCLRIKEFRDCGQVLDH